MSSARDEGLDVFAVLSIVIFIVVVVNGVCLCFSVGSVIAMACVGCVHNCFPFRARINDTNVRVAIQTRLTVAMLLIRCGEFCVFLGEFGNGVFDAQKCTSMYRMD